MSGQDFGREIGERSGQYGIRRDGLGEPKVSDTKHTEPRRVRQRAAAKIGNLNLPAKGLSIGSFAVDLPSRGDQNIGRLQVFMQNANVVRRGDSVCNLD